MSFYSPSLDISKKLYSLIIFWAKPKSVRAICANRKLWDKNHFRSRIFLFGFHCNAALVFTGVSWRFPQVHSPVLNASFSFEAEKSRWKFVPLNYLKFRFLSPFLKNLVLFAKRWPHNVGTPAEGPGGTRLRELKFSYEHRLHNKT